MPEVTEEQLVEDEDFDDEGERDVEWYPLPPQLQRIVDEVEED